MIHLGLIGYPLAQSLSPRLHGAALYTLGISGEYRLYPIPALPHGAEMLEERISAIRSGELIGLNVTIPHKQTVMRYMDSLTERAQAIGAVNTIFRRGNVIVGDNTDAPAFSQDLNSQLRMLGGDQPNYSRDRLALVIGAGGAARAVVYSLLAQNWRVILAARRVEQAEELRKSFLERQPGIQQALAAVRLEGPAVGALAPNLIVNASSAGMIPLVETNPWPAGLPLPEGAFIYDLVYKPPETALIRTARQAGLKAANGLGMLVEQAALALEIWCGCSAPRTAMSAAIGHLQTGPSKNSLKPKGGLEGW